MYSCNYNDVVCEELNKNKIIETENSGENSGKKALKKKKYILICDK